MSRRASLACLSVRYGAAALAVLVAMLVRVPLDARWGERLPYFTFWPAVFGAAWLGGLGPGLCATLLAALAVVLRWATRAPASGGADFDPLALALFVGVCVAISAVSEAGRRAQRRARDSAADAQRQADERRRAQERGAFLAEASAVLTSSLDYELTLERLCRLAVPRLADLAAVDMVDGTGTRRLATAHVDPDKEAFVRELRERHGFNPDAPSGVPRVIRTGEPAFVPAVTEPDLAVAARSPEQLAMFQTLGMLSWIIVPLTARRRVLGALTFVTTRDSGRRYGLDDLALARDLAARAAVAVDNALLYREAQAANRAKDEFLAVLSHELRTPLNAVYGWAHMLLSGRLDPDRARKGLEVIARNADVQRQLIDDLLDVSRIVSGKMRLELRPVDVRTLVDAALDAVAPAAAAKGVALERDLLARAAPVMGDPARLQQVVWNLLINAVKFTPPRGRVVARLADAAGAVEIQVTDTGQGIAPALLPHIFDRFRQGDSSTTRAQGGLGLGLALVRHLVELHGGSVHAESAGEGHGATFTVRLPAAATAAPARAAVEAAAAPSLHGVRVLVVEDDADALDLVRTVLATAGAEVRTVSSAAAALATLDAWRPNVVVSDIEMPETDGYALIAALRARDAEHGGRVPAVALSAYGREEDRLRTLAAGFQMHLAKPVEPAHLVAVVASLAGLSR